MPEDEDDAPWEDDDDEVIPDCYSEYISSVSNRDSGERN